MKARLAFLLLLLPLAACAGKPALPEDCAANAMCAARSAEPAQLSPGQAERHGDQLVLFPTQGQKVTFTDGVIDQRNFDNRLTGANSTLQAGNLRDAQAQKLGADQVNRWYARDNEDWTRLGMLQQAASGAAGPYGTQIATERQPVGIGDILSGFGSLAKKG